MRCNLALLLIQLDSLLVEKDLAKDRIDHIYETIISVLQYS